MTAYVLIIVLNAYGMTHTVSTQTFYSERRCEAAAEYIKEHAKAVRSVACVRK